MNKRIIQGLVDLNVFISKAITKEAYTKALLEKNDTRYTYTKTEGRDWYYQIDTQNLTTEEINLLLNIDKANSLRSIKKGVIFFVVVSVISIIISIIGAVNIASLF